MLARRALLRHFEKAEDLSPALLLIENHPELADSASLEPLRALASKSKQFEPCAKVLERFGTQLSFAQASAERQLALLLGDWAESELEAFQTESALAHLQRSAELAPDCFPVARRLAELRSQRGDTAAAAETLEKFLRAAQIPEERESARQLLARLRPAG
jgi:tetratricopeptide (TPR) repeat protein